MATLGKKLMNFIDNNGLVDNRVPAVPGSIADAEGRTSGWKKDAEAKINEFLTRTITAAAKEPVRTTIGNCLVTHNEEGRA